MRLTKSQPPRVTEEAKRTGEFSGSPSPRESSDLDASFLEAGILLVTRRVSFEVAHFYVGFMLRIGIRLVRRWLAIV